MNTTTSYHTTRPILVVGTGTMGAGIAQVAAAAGEKVLLYDQLSGAAGKAVQRIADSLRRAEAKGYVSAELVQATLGNLQTTADLSEGRDASVIVEAIKEDLNLKKQLFQQLEALVSPETAIWSNTSMLSITEMGDAFTHPARFCGVHFFNPVPRMPLVEVIAGKTTAESILIEAIARTTAWGKVPVRAPDVPGFIVNRIFDGIKRSALELLDLGVAPEAIDQAAKLGLNFPMGPLELMDLIGLDTTLDVLVNQGKATGRPVAAPTKLHELVAAGKLGRKSGEGFYKYS